MPEILFAIFKDHIIKIALNKFLQMKEACKMWHVFQTTMKVTMKVLVRIKGIEPLMITYAISRLQCN